MKKKSFWVVKEMVPFSSCREEWKRRISRWEENRERGKKNVQEGTIFLVPILDTFELDCVWCFFLAVQETNKTGDTKEQRGRKIVFSTSNHWNGDVSDLYDYDSMTLYLIKQQAIIFFFLMTCFYYSRMIINFFPFPLVFRLTAIGWRSPTTEVVDLFRGNKVNELCWYHNNWLHGVDYNGIW